MAITLSAMVWCCCCARKKSPSKEESCCCSCWCCCWCMAAVWWYWQRLLLLVPLRDDRLEGKRRILRATGAETSPFTLERFNINDCGRKLHDHNNFLDNVLESKKRLATDVARSLELTTLGHLPPSLRVTELFTLGINQHHLETWVGVR